MEPKYYSKERMFTEHLYMKLKKMENKNNV